MVSGTVPDAATTQRLFFDALFPDLEGYIELRGISREGKKPVQRFFSSVEALCGAIPQTAEAQKGYDLYFGVLPRATEDGTKAAIKLGTTIWVDIDSDIEAAEKQIRLTNYTALINSGHGLHAYWVLPEPEELDTPEAIATFEARLKKGAALFGGDQAATDIARIMRVPGTWNMKP